MVADKKQADRPKESGTESQNQTETVKRKPWVKKDAAESMLSLIAKQEQRVAKMQKDLDKETKQLEKLHRAKKVLESAS